MSERVMEGGCACGQTRYRVTGEPVFVNDCYCTLCQRQTGSTSAINAFFEAEAFALTAGEVSRHAVPAGSGGDHVISRCSACGTALWSRYPGLEQGVGIRVGTLDEPGAVRPDACVFTASRMPWVTLPEGIPHFETYYKPSKLLPPERFARLMAMVQGQADQQGKPA